MYRIIISVLKRLFMLTICYVYLKKGKGELSAFQRITHPCLLSSYFLPQAKNFPV
jgi:hypothetical protein